MQFATMFTSMFNEISAESLKQEAEAKKVITRLKAIKANLDSLESEEPFEEFRLAA